MGYFHKRQPVENEEELESDAEEKDSEVSGNFESLNRSVDLTCVILLLCLFNEGVMNNRGGGRRSMYVTVKIYSCTLRFLL